MTRLSVLFTKSNKWGSRLIRWGLREPVSHVAVQIGEWVYHSSVAGVDRISSDEFMASYEVMLQVDLNTKISPVESLWQRYKDKAYDYRSILYLAWRVLLQRCIGTPIPATNPWNDKHKYLCTEFAEIIIGVDFHDTITPAGMFTKLLKFEDSSFSTRRS